MIINMDDLEYAVLTLPMYIEDSERIFLKECSCIEDAIGNSCFSWILYSFCGGIIQSILLEMGSHFGGRESYFISKYLLENSWPEMEERIREFSWARLLYESLFCQKI